MSATPEQMANRVKWLEALRSGQYKQGKGRLNNDGNYCCLGVACEIVAPEGKTGTDSSGNTKYFEDVACLPIEVQNLLGLRSCNPLVLKHRVNADGSGHTMLCATTMNDGEGMSFVQIAAALEPYLTNPHYDGLNAKNFTGVPR